MKNILSIIILLIFLMLTNAFPQNWNAVCVGINDYPGTANDLNYCVRDATYIKTYLINYKQWYGSRINLLTDVQADKTGIQGAVTNMSTSPGNTNLFFFSGHGASVD